MFQILYQDAHMLIIQTHANQFDKWGDDLYGDFNVAMHVGDDNERVLKNRALLLDKLNQLTNHKISSIHWLNQIHSDVVIDIDGYNLPLMDADALMTDKDGTGLSIMTADCVPIALFNDVKNQNTDNSQIACIHAGWQGLTKGIIKNTYDKFKDKNIKAIIGACISQANYEIDKSLANDIIKTVINKQLVALSADELYQQIIIDKENDKCLIDIVKLTKLQLNHLNIDVLSDDVPCSYGTPNLYSYRQQTHAKKQATGRMAMVIVKF